MPASTPRHAQPSSGAHPSPDSLGLNECGLSEWLASVTGAFQALLLLARTSQVDREQLEAQIGRVPAPRNAVETLVIRYFVDDCLIAILKDGGLSHSPALLRHFADVITSVHRHENPLAELARALYSVCQVNSDIRLANTITARLEQELGQRRITARTFTVEYRLGRTELDRLFRERFGVGFHRYLTAMRVKRGLDLVMGGMKVEAAASSVGYKSKKDFYRAVKEETGSTPGKLRRALRSDVASC